MRKIILFLIFFPRLTFAQDDYIIYSTYLNQVKTELNGKADFIICESTDYGRGEDSDITNIVTNLRNFVKKNYTDLSDCHCTSFVPLVQKDTSWIGLIETLEQKIKSEYILKSDFAPELHATVIKNRDYKRYFKNTKPILKNWKRFHKKYPVPAYLINLSTIVKDNSHAVFYFSRTWDGVGNGCLVLFYREGLEWKFLQTLHIWDA